MNSCLLLLAVVSTFPLPFLEKIIFLNPLRPACCYTTLKFADFHEWLGPSISDLHENLPLKIAPLTPRKVRKKIVRSLQSHFILTMSHWFSGLPVCFLSQGTQVQITWGDLCETGILLIALSCYIGDPDVINHHCGLIPNHH
jgi:hypothetical protein